jgi:hypothetical protein
MFCSMFIWMAVSDQILDYARRLFDRQGDRALIVTRDMIAHLKAIRDPDRLKDWRRIVAEIERLVRVQTRSPSGTPDTEALPSMPRARKVERHSRHAEGGFWRRVGIELERIRNQQQID